MTSWLLVLTACSGTRFHNFLPPCWRFEGVFMSGNHQSEWVGDVGKSTEFPGTPALAHT